MPLAYIFPGQGSQYPGMGKNLVDNFSAARLVFEEADDSLGLSISRLCFWGPDEALQLTENTQPAILAVSIAALRVMQNEGFPPPGYVAGHSLGEYSALVAAGSISFADAVRRVRARGRYMQEAVPLGVGAMSAVLGSTLDEIERICKEASHNQVCAPANINSANQVVIAGHTEAVGRAEEMLKAVGVRRVVRLNVSAPFHCALMKPAQESLEQDLAQLPFNDLTTPLVTNVDAKDTTSGATMRDSLVRQVSSPVRWLESIQLMRANGCDTFVEVGPGKILSGLMRQIDREVKTLNVEDSDSLKAAGKDLKVFVR